MTIEAVPPHVEDRIEVSASGSALVLAIHGDLDIAVTDSIAPRLISAVASTRHVILDVGAVTFCDSTGIAMFCATQELADASKCRLQFRNLPAALRRVFQITGVDGLFDLGGTP
jgi:anti-sigma B factor antagonist